MAHCDQLQHTVRILFEEFVIPTNVKLQCESILSKNEMQYIVAKAKRKGPLVAARRLFNILVRKEGWFSIVQNLLRDKDVKLQHVADIMTTESNRFQPQSASHRSSNRNTRSEYVPETETLSALYIQYNRDLDRQIRRLFLAKIGNPDMALHLFQKYSDKVLTKIDCENVKAEVQNKGDHEGADLLFSRLVLYNGWLEVLLQVFRDDDMRLSTVAANIADISCEIKEDYEKKRSKIQHLYNTDENMQLADNRTATDDPGSVEMVSDTRDRPLRDSNVRDEYESDSAVMRPAVKRQARSASNKENTVSDGSGDSRDLASQGGASEDGHGTTGKTELMSAAASEDEHGTTGKTELMSAAASEDGHGTTGKTELMSAAASGNINLILSLIDGRADLNESDSKGRTSLMYSVVKRQVECVRLLISKGCNVNKRDINGCTALMISADKGFPDCMACLIEGMSDLDNANNAGATALMVAAKNGFVDCMRWLIRRRCDIDKRNNDGRTALMFAAFEGNIECVDLLITSSCFVDERDNKRATALMYAAKGGQQECVKLLIKGCADVNLVDEECNTAVMYAVLFNQVECLKILIVNHADFNIANKYGFTPLKVAKIKKFKQCVTELRLQRVAGK